MNADVIIHSNEFGELSWYSYGLDGKGSIPARGKEFFLLHGV
jgi:hypothetical protein